MQMLNLHDSVRLFVLFDAFAQSGADNSEIVLHDRDDDSISETLVQWARMRNQQLTTTGMIGDGMRWSLHEVKVGSVRIVVHGRSFGWASGEVGRDVDAAFDDTITPLIRPIDDDEDLEAAFWEASHLVAKMAAERDKRDAAAQEGS